MSSWRIRIDARRPHQRCWRSDWACNRMSILGSSVVKESKIRPCTKYIKRPRMRIYMRFHDSPSNPLHQSLPGCVWKIMNAFGYNVHQGTNELQEKRPSIIEHSADEGKDKIQATLNDSILKGVSTVITGKCLHQIQRVGGDDATEQSRTTVFKTSTWIIYKKASTY